MPTTAPASGAAAVALAVANGGAALLEYAVACALPAGEAITVDGRRYEGRLGLAPHWSERDLSVGDQRWLTACLLARTNFFGATVTISTRGPSASLSGAVTRDEAARYAIQEGAFYGNLWSDPPEAWVCEGDGDASLAARRLRVCGEASGLDDGFSRCGFRIAGKCADVCAPREHDGAMRRCRGGDATFDEVITVFLERP